ncbi:MAG: MFS transporter, partial [Rubrivivax sp.]|nr:MFS transporter [Rubrivivax sp.]
MPAATDPARPLSGHSAEHPPEVETRTAWIVVWASFTALAVIFGVSYSFAAFFAPLQQQFAATRADVSLLFGVSGLIYFVLGAGAGMLADRFGPR